MSETRTVHDPFLGKDVEVSNRLVDRLRGRYACGPMMPNGEPEFGWRQFIDPSPIQKEAADEIERLQEDIAVKARLLTEQTKQLVKVKDALRYARAQLVTLGGDIRSDEPFADQIQKAVLAKIDSALTDDQGRA